MSWFWILSQVLPSRQALAKRYHSHAESHRLLPQSHHLLLQSHCSCVLHDTHHSRSRIWEYWEHSSPQGSDKSLLISLPLLASNSPWCIPANSYTLPNPHHNLLCPKFPFQTANGKSSSTDMRRGNSFDHWVIMVIDDHLVKSEV